MSNLKRAVILVLCLLVCLSAGGCGLASMTEFIVDTAQSEYEKEDESAQTVFSFDGEEITILDNRQCSLRITSIDGTGFSVVCKNKSYNTQTFTVDSVAINGWMANFYWSDEVRAGRECSAFFEFNRSTLPEGISVPEKLTMHIDVTYYNNWEADPAADCVRTVYTAGVTEETFSAPERITFENEIELLNDDRFSFILLDADMNGISGPEISCCIENRTDKFVTVNPLGFAVNGWTVEPHFLAWLLPESSTYATFTIEDPAMEFCGIESLDRLDFDLVISDAADYSAPDILEESISVSLSDTAVSEPERQPMDGEQVIMDNERCTVILEPMIGSTEDTRVFSVYIHNRSDFNMSLILDDFEVNGDIVYTISSYRRVRPGAHCRAVVVVTPYNLSSRDLDDLETVSCLLEVRNVDDFSEKDMISQDIEWSV